ncbi:hypothetical protein OHT68_13085 [Streptomyces canus]|uniref:hypothetical protein n=1 Tax=Streptomyces canus TaxID=58343 RepID=UPI002E28BB35|nr:hypothetical protein [Streptomyces canus]
MSLSRQGLFDRIRRDNWQQQLDPGAVEEVRRPPAAGAGGADLAGAEAANAAGAVLAADRQIPTC